MSVLIIGVGAMGSAIGARLRDSGVAVLGVDPLVFSTAGGESVRAATADGVTVLRDLSLVPRELGDPPSDVLICVRLPEQVVGVLERMDQMDFFDGVAVAVLSTLAPSDARGICQRFGRDRALAETPLSGGIGGARTGTLTVLAAGPVGSWPGAIADQVVRFSEAGQPALAKLLNNLLAAANVRALAAVLVRAEELGVSARSMHEVVLASSGASWMAPHLEDFPVELLWKDVMLLEGDVPVHAPRLGSETEFSAQIEAARALLR